MDATHVNDPTVVQFEASAETDSDDEQSRSKNSGSSGGGDAVYALGMIGAAVYLWRHADTAGGKARALLKSLVWPAFLVYEAFSALDRRGDASCDGAS